MKKIILIFCNTLLRSKMILPLSLLCGIGLCIGFNLASGTDEGSGGGGGIPVGLLAREETAVTEDFREYLTGELGMELTESADIELLNTEMVERNISAVIEVPDGFEAALLTENPVPLEVSFLDDYTNAAFISGYLESYTAGLNTLALAADGDEALLTSLLDKMRTEAPPVTTHAAESEAAREESRQYAFRLIIGFYMMICFFLAYGTASQLFDDRKDGLFNRIKASNVHTVQYLTGVCASGMLFGLLIAAPFLIYMAVFKPDIAVPVWQAGVLSLLYNLFVTAVSVTVALYLKSKNAILSIIVGTATIMNMVSGAFIPIELTPEFIRQAARVTPAYWFINAVENLQADINAGWWLNAAVIMMFAMVFFILSGIKYAQGGRKKR